MSKWGPVIASGVLGGACWIVTAGALMPTGRKPSGSAALAEWECQLTTAWWWGLVAHMVGITCGGALYAVASRDSSTNERTPRADA